jgi:hypothetical protein
MVPEVQPRASTARESDRTHLEESILHDGRFDVLSLIT